MHLPELQTRHIPAVQPRSSTASGSLSCPRFKTCSRHVTAPRCTVHSKPCRCGAGGHLGFWFGLGGRRALHAIRRRGTRATDALPTSRAAVSGVDGCAARERQEGVAAVCWALQFFLPRGHVHAAAGAEDLEVLGGEGGHSLGPCGRRSAEGIACNRPATNPRCRVRCCP